MTDKIKVKIIELDKVELKPGAKYVFCLHPAVAYGYLEHLKYELERLVGVENFTILPVSPHNLKIYEVLPREEPVEG